MSEEEQSLQISSLELNTILQSSFAQTRNEVTREIAEIKLVIITRKSIAYRKARFSSLSKHLSPTVLIELYDKFLFKLNHCQYSLDLHGFEIGQPLEQESRNVFEIIVTQITSAAIIRRINRRSMLHGFKRNQTSEHGFRKIG
jgi:hypothetical protein